MTPAGFPHSDIHGSMPACGSPWLFAAYHVFLRRPVPWHPPCALCNLIVTKLSSCQSFYFDSLFLRPTAKLFSQLVSYKMFSIWLCSFQGALQGSFLRSLKTIQVQEDDSLLPALRRTSFFLRSLLRHRPGMNPPLSLRILSLERR